MATTESDGMYSCNICSKTFQLQSMYACYHGHYLCRKCYKQIYYGRDRRCCPHSMCTAFLVSNQDDKSEPLERSRMMFPNPDIFSENKPQATGSIISLASMYRPSLLSLGYSSKKPVHCPHNGCNKTIAVSSLDSHFEHDHEHVATIVTKLETRNGLDFYFKDLHGHIETLCLVLIHIEPKEGEDSFGESTAPTTDTLLNQQRSVYSKFSQLSPPTKPFFIVMAAKLSAGDNSIMDDEELDLLATGFSPIDRLIFYVSSNIPTTYSYTIAVSTPDQGIRAKYYGPLLSVNEDYKMLCEDGKGLILNHNHVDGMSDGGTRNVCLDVIIHERGDETYDSD